MKRVQMQNRYVINNFILRQYVLQTIAVCSLVAIAPSTLFASIANESAYTHVLKQTATGKVLGAKKISWGDNVAYDIIKLNENEMTPVQQGDGWRNIWMFKRKGFVF